jgi:hypothetical protein
MEGKLDHRWRKSSYSGNGGGNCVEVGRADRIVVRDSQDREGPRLAVTADEWRAFTRNIKGR